MSWIEITEAEYLEVLSDAGATACSFSTNLRSRGAAAPVTAVSMVAITPAASR
jgi:hypothetical protein